MKFLCQLLFAHLLRRKIRLVFLLLALTAACSLVVWTIGGYEALSSPSKEEKTNLGGYDLMLTHDYSSLVNALEQGTSNTPLSLSEIANGQSIATNIPSIPFLPPELLDETGRISLERIPAEVPPPILALIKTADKDRDGFLNQEELKRLIRQFAPLLKEMAAEKMSFSRTLINELKSDPKVEYCDEVVTSRVFVYAKNREIADQSSLQDQAPQQHEEEIPSAKKTMVDDDLFDDELDSVETEKEDVPNVPAGIDPELYREGWAKFNNTWGTHRDRLTLVAATSATAVPSPLEGRWLSQDKNSREAILTIGGKKRLKVEIGDDLLLMTPTGCLQLKVVGVVDQPLYSGLFVPMALAESLKEHRESVSLLLKLRCSTTEFKESWNDRLLQFDPPATIRTSEEIQAGKRAQVEQRRQIFQNQSRNGIILATIIAVFIIFTALNVSVAERRRSIALLRTVGMTRLQVGIMILMEAVFLALMGWISGLITGWYLVWYYANFHLPITPKLIFLSAICTIGGSLIAALYPLLQSIRVRPLEAFAEPTKGNLFQRNSGKQRNLYIVMSSVGILCLATQWSIVHLFIMNADRRAMLQSGVGTVLLVGGALLLLPLIVQLVQWLFIPIIAKIFQINALILRNELAGNTGRTVALAAVMTLSGGFFVSMHIFGNSLLDLFLPSRAIPSRLSVLWPTGIQENLLSEIRQTTGIVRNDFIPFIGEQLALDSNDVSLWGHKDPKLLNVIMIGLDTEKGLRGSHPLIGLRFLKGNREEALDSLRKGNSVVISDSLAFLYRKKVHDRLKVVHPDMPTVVFDFEIAAIISLSGWPSIMEESGLLRRYRHTTGLVFIDATSLQNIVNKEDRFNGFWFNITANTQSVDLEQAFKKVANKQIQHDQKNTDIPVSVRITEREAAEQKVRQEAERVIWGLSKMPLITLTITAMALMGVVSNSVRSRRWQFGVMRSVGVTKRGIILLILAESILLGLVAAIASFCFGLFAAEGALQLVENVFGTDSPPLVIPWSGLFYGLGWLMALCLAAAIVPAMITGLKTPLELIQSGRSSE